MKKGEKSSDGTAPYNVVPRLEYVQRTSAQILSAIGADGNILASRLERALLAAPLRGAKEVLGKVNCFRVRRNPSRIDAKRGDHFLQSDKPGTKTTFAVPYLKI